MSKQEWTLEEVQAADLMLKASYEAGRVLNRFEVGNMLGSLCKLFLLSDPYVTFPTLEDFLKFMHDDPRVQGALKRST